MVAERLVAFFPLATGLLFMAGFAAWVFIHSHKSYRLRWLLIPSALIVATLTYLLYDVRLGYSVPEPLPDKFVYLGHHVVIAHNQKVGIEVWAQTRDTRLYEVAYSRELEQILEFAKKKAQQGQPVVMEKGKEGREGKGTKGDGKDEPFQSNIVLPDQINPKVAQ